MKSSGKCYFFQQLECRAIYPNPGDTCMQVKYAGFHRVRGLKIDAKALATAQAVLRHARIDFMTARPAERGRLLLLVEDLSIPAASSALQKAGVPSTIEPIPQGPLR